MKNPYHKDPATEGFFITCDLIKLLEKFHIKYDWTTGNHSGISYFNEKMKLYGIVSMLEEGGKTRLFNGLQHTATVDESIDEIMTLIGSVRNGVKTSVEG